MDSETASRAIGALLDNGVRPEDISILAKEIPTPSNQEPRAADDVRSMAERGITTTTPEDAQAGAAKGAGVGLGVGAVAAIAALALPGVGIVMGGGALALTLAGVAGAGAAGAIAGAVTGSLKDQGLDEESAQTFSQTVTTGGALISVDTPSNDVSAVTIEGILIKYGATSNGMRSIPRTPASVGPVS